MSFPWEGYVTAYWNCVENCYSFVHECTVVNAIHVTEKAFFERLYLVLGLSQFEPRVKCPCAPIPPPFDQQLFLEFFPRIARQFFCHHDSPSNLDDRVQECISQKLWTQTEVG